ncbi:EamA family transporter RarD [Nakamurella flavida]|uniref:EamA family transporter RarD n=1 Tax=Nakamurella flavida TaxID=363630 RepID=A0A939BZK9_9ACTN|nr:EamA family transporter RarD [Nakamurella flavida]MBM9475828.1 EamA family transporter RarD [Nakamurella flavida]MDP9777889.1 chloramphenicol-sensitive protein RarD [Nakamurella flavida]
MAFGVAAYLIWGLFPLYWPLLHPAGALEILAHRMIWSLAVMAVVMTVTRGWPALRVPARVWVLVAAAAVLIAVNWGVYIWAVNNGRVVDAALGYFVNPLVSVLLGVAVFRERLRPAQWVAVGLGAAAVLVIGVAGGSVPWVALVLAASFGLYGLVKKVVPLPPAASLTAEGLVLLVPALGFLVVLQVTGASTLTGNGTGHVVLLAGAGLLTCVPLLAFATAARALPLSTLGLLQYLTPVAQFLLGVFWAHEAMSPSRWVGFGMIWLALTVLSVDGLRRIRRQAAAPTPAPTS